ncbi:MAG TPA: DUF3348 family protein [Lysobacter sp.]
MEHSSRAQDGGPTLVHLLAHFAGTVAPPPPQAPSSHLAHWVDWRQAVALAAALESRPAPEADPAPGPEPGGEDECARLRATLVRSIDGDRAFAADARHGGGTPKADFYRQRCIALQQLMGAEVGLLRKRRRERLARRSHAFARLAAVDAVMEQALAPRERALLASVPAALACHFERLREAHGGDRDDVTPWLDRFRRDLRTLLLAELDLRLQPARGLSSALRNDMAGPHAD